MIIEPFEQQLTLLKHVLDNETTVIVYGGGIRGGKTFGALLATFIYLKKYAGARAVIVRDSIPTLFRNTVPSYNKLTPVKKVTNQQQLQAPIKYRDSELLFFGENFDHDKDLNRWKGLETNLIELEEFNELQEASFDKSIERAGSYVVPGLPPDKQPPPKILATVNPTNGWVKERIYDRWRAGTLPRGWVFIPALLEDNPHLSTAYKESLKNLPRKHYEVFVEGKWESLEVEGLFAYEFSEEKHVTKENIQPSYHYELILSFDFNISNTCLIEQLQGNKWIVFKEYHMKGGIEVLCEQIKKDYPDFVYVVNGDASGRAGSGLTSGNASYYELIRNCFDMRVDYVLRYVPESNPTHKNSYLLTNFLLKNMDVTISYTCEGLIRDMKNVRVQTLPTFNIIKKDDKLTHHLDPFRYTGNAMLYHMLTIAI